MIRKLLLTTFLFLIPAVCFSAWKFNAYTGKLDFYLGGSTTGENATFSQVDIGNTLPGGLLNVGTYPTQGLYVTQSGNVGIGTTNPIVALHIKSSGELLKLDGNTGGYLTLLENSVTKWNVGENAPDDSFRISTGAFTTTSKLVILPGGNVGIGTTDPLGTLSVGTSNTVPNLFVSATGNVGIGTTGTKRQLVVSFINDNNINMGYAGDTTIIYAIDNGNSVYRPLTFAGSRIGFTTGFGSSTNVGIGSTSPTSTLQIIGTGTGTQQVLCRTTTGQIGTCDTVGVCGTCTPF